MNAPCVYLRQDNPKVALNTSELQLPVISLFEFSPNELYFRHPEASLTHYELIPLRKVTEDKSASFSHLNYWTVRYIELQSLNITKRPERVQISL